MVGPVELGGGAFGGGEAEQAGRPVEREQRAEDPHGVVVVDAAFVPLLGSGLGGGADQRGQVGGGEGLGAVVGEEAGGEVFCAVELGGLRGRVCSQ